jgi:hypothetical protein
MVALWAGVVNRAGARARHRRARRAAVAPTAVLAAALGLVIAGCSQNGGAAPGSTSAAGTPAPTSSGVPAPTTVPAHPAVATALPAGVRGYPAGIPAYYVALTEYSANPVYSANSGNFREPPIVVGQTLTGERVATVPPPAGTGFTGVTGAADDRTYVVSTALNSVSPGAPAAFTGAPRTWYRLRIAPGSVPAYRLTRLPIPVTPDGVVVAGVALSPDGTELAMALQPSTSPAEPGPEALRVYSMSTGAVLRSWSGPANAIASGYLDASSSGLDNNTILSWADDGRELAFDGRWTTGSGAGVYGLRTLSLSRPGQDLLADSRVLWSVPRPASGLPQITAKAPLSCATDLQITPDGSTVVCGAVGILRAPGPNPSGAWNDRAFLEYSAATGKLTRVIGTWRTGQLPFKSIAVLWSDRSGSPLIGYMADRAPGPGADVGLHIAVFSAGRYQPLPNLPDGAEAATTAW